MVIALLLQRVTPPALRGAFSTRVQDERSLMRPHVPAKSIVIIKSTVKQSRRLAIGEGNRDRHTHVMAARIAERKSGSGETCERGHDS